MCFNNFATVDEGELNVACQHILCTLFTMLENLFHGLNGGFEKEFLDYLMCKTFQHFYETTLPGSIQNNRGGAIYLVESLKSFFEQWYSDAFAKLIVIDFGDESKDHLDDESFVLQTQYFVGGAFNKLQEKFVSPSAKNLLASMGFKSHTGNVDQD